VKYALGVASVEISKARAAKEHLADELSGDPAVHGVGIAPVADGYALLVHVLESAAEARVPTEVDGVDVHVDVSGPGQPEPV
jgi:hypothetical protein